MAETSHKERMSGEEQRGWDALLAQLDRIPPTEMETPGAGPDDWSARDVLFHLAAWIEEAAAQLDAIRGGRYESSEIDTDARNEEYLRAGRSLDVPAVRLRLERAHARLQAEWLAVEELSAPAIEWFGEDGAEHYAEHLPELRAFADRVGSDERPGAADRRAGLLAAEREGWNEIESVIAGMPHDALERPGVTPGGWTVKDTMYHVAMWWRDLAESAPKFADPSFDPSAEAEAGGEELNRRWFEESRGLDLDVVRTRWTDERAGGLAAFAAMPAPSRTAERWLEECGPIHYEQHLIDLRPWAAALRGSGGARH